MELKAKLKREDIQDSDNIADLFTGDEGKEDLKSIGSEVVNTYDIDKQSRKKWEKKMEVAMSLALQITEPKSYPWPNAANVKFPLLTIAALQFQSRAYPALVKAPDLVKYRVQGSDPDGAKAARSARISPHMSWQRLEQDEGWEEDRGRVRTPRSSSSPAASSEATPPRGRWISRLPKAVETDRSMAKTAFPGKKAG